MKELKIDATTKLTDLADAYPWLVDEAVKLSDKLKVLKSPMGRMLVKGMTIKDASKKANIAEADLIGKINEMISAHTGKK
ncbi:MAG: hypothetical protein K6G61_09800 [Solobacterium sp.]|nr:hypothetical protein [Solobacterium sp.]